MVELLTQSEKSSIRTRLHQQYNVEDTAESEYRCDEEGDGPLGVSQGIAVDEGCPADDTEWEDDQGVYEWVASEGLVRRILQG